MEVENKRGFVWPLVLIAVGVIFLLDNFGVMDVNPWFLLSRLWPLLLVAFGLEVIFGRRSGVGSIVSLVIIVVVFSAGYWIFVTQAENFSTDLETVEIVQLLEGASDAKVEIDMGIGELDLGSTQKADTLAVASLTLFENEELRQEFKIDGDTALFELGTRMTRSFAIPVFPPFGFFDTEHNWEIDLSQAVPINLELNTGVGLSNIDLEDLNITNLEIDTGVGQTIVTLPVSGDFDARISGGVGELRVRVPKGTAIRIRVDSGVGDVSVRGDYQRDGNTYTSPTYNDSEDRIDLFVSGGVGSIRIDEVGN